MSSRSPSPSGSSVSKSSPRKASGSSRSRSRSRSDRSVSRSVSRSPSQSRSPSRSPSSRSRSPSHSRSRSPSQSRSRSPSPKPAARKADSRSPSPSPRRDSPSRSKSQSKSKSKSKSKSDSRSASPARAKARAPPADDSPSRESPKEKGKERDAPQAVAASSDFFALKARTADDTERMTYTDDTRAWKEDKRVVAFLREQGAYRYRAVFEENEIDYPALLLVTDDALLDMGVPKELRRKLLQAIDKLPPNAAIPEGDHEDELTKAAAKALEALNSENAAERTEALRTLHASALDGYFNESVVRRLLELVKRSVINDVLSVLDAFVQNDRARLTVERADGAAQFSTLLSSNADGKNSKGTYLVLRILRTLCRSNINVKTLRQTNGLHTVLQGLARQGVPDVQEGALELLFILAFDNRAVQDSIFVSETPRLATYLRLISANDTNPRVRGAAAKVLGALVSGAEGANVPVQKALNTQVLALLVQMLRRTPVEQVGAATAIAYMVDNSPKKKRWMLRSGSLPSLVYLLTSPNKDVQQAGARAVRGVMHQNFYAWPPRSTLQRQTVAYVREALHQAGVVPALAALLPATRSSLREEAVGALAQLVADNNDLNAYADAVWEALWPQSIVETLSLSSPSGQFWALQLIEHLAARNPVRRRAFVLANAPEAVKKLSVSQNRDVSQLAPHVVHILTHEPERPVWRVGPVSIPRPF